MTPRRNPHNGVKTAAPPPSGVCIESKKTDSPYWQPFDHILRLTVYAPSTGTRMCDRLVGKGLIARRVPAENRREVELSITAAGAAIVKRVAADRRRQLRAITDRMSARSQAALVEALEEFSAAAGEVPEHQWYLGWE